MARKEIWLKGSGSTIGGPPPDDWRAYQEAWKRIGDVLLPELFQKVKDRVRHPLNELNYLFHGPDKLIAKRDDKMLDFEAASGRSEKAPEQEKTAKAEYEALNRQLLSELPRLSAQSQEILKTCVRALIAAQRVFAYGLKEALKPLEHFYVSGFDFDAADSNELSVTSGQVLAVHMKQDLEGNDEWWLLEDEFGGVGYVPANYVQILPA